MRKLCRYLLVTMCLALGLCGTAGAVGAAVSKTADCVYSSYAGYWADPAKAYLYADDEELVRVELIDGEVVVEHYDSDFNCLSQETFEMELPGWGGFFAGEDYNFLVFGQDNMAEDDTAEVVRVVRYSKDWERIDHASLFGANTTKPFRAGGLSMAEYGGLLYIHTCHEMYTSSDGLNHQANLSLIIRQSDMTITDRRHAVLNKGSGYVSHSFNQLVMVDSDGYVVKLDHGDAYPRGVYLFREMSPAGTEKPIYYGAGGTLATFGGYLGQNYTGGRVTGLDETSTGYLCLYSTTWKEDGTEGNPDLYLTWAAKDLSRAVPHLVAENVLEGQIVSTGTDCGYILWKSEDDGAMYYAIYGADGSVGDPVKINARRSDCQPIVWNDKVVWYATDYSAPVFYLLDASGLESTTPDAEDGGGKLNFTFQGGQLYAQWDAPLSPDQFSYYFVYAADAQDKWVQIAVAWADEPRASLLIGDLPAGEYNKFLVTMADAYGQTVRNYIASNTTLTITDCEAPAPTVALVEEYGAYSLAVSGLAPSTPTYCRFTEGDRNVRNWSGTTSSGGGISFPVSNLFLEGGSYSLWQLPEVTVTEEGIFLRRATLAEGEPIPGVKEDSGVSGDADYAVTDIHFELSGEGVPFLWWSAFTELGERYVVYVSKDNGTTWEPYNNTDQYFMDLRHLAPGTYNAVKVATLVSNQEVAARTASDLTLTITQGEDLPAAEMLLSKNGANGVYLMEVSGLTPETGCRITFRGSYDISGACHTGPDGTATDVKDAEFIESMAAVDGTYLIQEFHDSEISSDGKSVAMTVRNRGQWEKVADALEKEEEPAGVTVSVRVAGDAEVTLGENTARGGDVSFGSVSKGTYDLKVKKGGCLTHTVKNITVEDEDIDLGEIRLVAGDVNEDGKINIQDMGTFRAEFGKTGDAIGNAYTDVNEDGKVNIQDMGTFRANFGKTAEKDCTVEYGA